MFTFLTRLQRRNVVFPSVGSRMMTTIWGWLGSTSLIGRRLNRVVRFQALAPSRGECVLARVIDSRTVKKFRFEINLHSGIFFDGLLRRILSSKGGGI